MNVVFLIFNRPDVTAQVFEAIRAARPKRLFVVADGPRVDRPGEAEKVVAARAVTEVVDWPCEVVRDYSDTNLGCGRRVSSGITRALEQVEDAIVLEDDCLPHESFFDYCTELLERYRDDERVMCISGDNFQQGVLRGSASYYFSKYPHCWGWATWRRAWRHFSLDIPSWPEARDCGVLDVACRSSRERQYWADNIEKAYRGESDTWNCPWQFAIWSQHGLTALPNVNLVSNIGFGGDASHTLGQSWQAALPVEEIGPLTHPRFIVPNVAADDFTDLTIFSGRRRPSDRPWSSARIAAGRVRRQVVDLLGGSV